MFVNVSPRWRKVCGDIGLARGRLFMMATAIAVAVFAVGAISSSYVILGREINRNYSATNPAAALLEVALLDDKAVAIAKDQEGVTAAESAGRFAGHVQVSPDEALPLLIFAAPDLQTGLISRVRLEQGHWPLEPASIVLERTALSVANTAVGQSIKVQGPAGVTTALTVAGAVHDPSLAPAWQEQTVYGYATAATLRLLGHENPLQILKITVRDPQDVIETERIATQVSIALERHGYTVGEIRIPPYGHPHQRMMTSVVRMLLLFSGLALVLSAVLVATLTASLLSPQVRQVGVMKAIGARTRQIMTLYMTLISVIGLLAVSIGLPLGLMAGRALALNTARLLNLEIASQSIPVWILASQVVAGVGLPLAAAIWPIWHATKVTVRESLNDFGIDPSSVVTGRFVRWLSRLYSQDMAFVIAVRNSIRRKRRIAFTLLLFSMAGAMFMTSINVKAAWARNLTQANSERRFDTELQFVHAEPMANVAATAAKVAGVRIVEPWGSDPVSVVRADGLRVVKTYPDGGHGSLQLQAVPFDSAFLRPSLISGRWLNPKDRDGVVINEQAVSSFPGSHIGDFLRIDVRGRVIELRLIGIVREHLTQATLYASHDDFSRLTRSSGYTNGLRVSVDRSDESRTQQLSATITRALETSGSRVAESISQAQLGRALGGHLFILIFTLIVMSILMALVGVMGLSSSCTIGVLERTREFAVMRVIGADNRTIRRSVIGEAVVIAGMSSLIAVLLSVPLTIGVAKIVGAASLGPALGTVFSTIAFPLWLTVALLGAVAASCYPATQAAKLSIPRALSYQ